MSSAGQTWGTSQSALLTVVWSPRDLQQSADDVRVCGVKGQPVHLHGQVTSFPASYPETHQSGEDGLLLVEEQRECRSVWGDLAVFIILWRWREKLLISRKQLKSNSLWRGNDVWWCVCVCVVTFSTDGRLAVQSCSSSRGVPCSGPSPLLRYLWWAGQVCSR